MTELVSRIPSNSTTLSTDSDHVAGGFQIFTRALARGEDAAWRDFLDRYGRRLRGYLTTCWHGDPHVVDDLLQEMLIRAVKHIRPFAEEEILWSWLTVLARSVVADHGRKQTRFHAFLERFRLQPPPQKPSSTPDNRLEQAIAELAPADRKLIRMKYEHSDSVRKIATTLAISEKAVEGRLTRCRTRLRRKLDNLTKR